MIDDSRSVDIAICNARLYKNINGVEGQGTADGKEAMRTENVQKPGDASPIIDAINAAGRDKGQNNDGNSTDNANGVNDAQNGSTALQQLKNDWEMCVQKGAEDEVSAGTQKEVKAVLGIADNYNAEADRGI